MLKAIIIDDEPKGRNILIHLIRLHFLQIKVVAGAGSADEGLKQMDIWKPDVVFLDVEMPGKSGFDMLNEIGDIDFKVIFVSAYNHYALNAIKLSALDFLLKPVDIEDLGKAIRRLHAPNSHSARQVPNLLQQIHQPKNNFGKIAIASVNAIEFVNMADIIYCKADNVYTEVHLRDSIIIATKNLKDFDETLSGYSFFRVHHSYLINMRHIQKYLKGDGGIVIMSNNAQIEVSRRRKTAFLELLAVI